MTEEIRQMGRMRHGQWPVRATDSQPLAHPNQERGDAFNNPKTERVRFIMGACADVSIFAH